MDKVNRAHNFSIGFARDDLDYMLSGRNAYTEEQLDSFWIWLCNKWDYSGWTEDLEFFIEDNLEAYLEEKN